MVDTEAPQPSPGEAQLEVAYTGICGTDLHILDGAVDVRVTTDLSGNGDDNAGITRWTAACYVGDRTVTLLETEPRRPGAGEVELDVAYTGICGTDLHIVHGAMDARVALPAVLGHEMSGSIAAVGEGVTGGRSAITSR